ncbi:YkvA family protein [Ottowia thiooxydans]|uniref:Uncharacterized membrane protein YkvA (DUF1232 family) n=1 Tax=Ottowia thiooxydans TaxID=219182 RepID=A0ABV2Q5U4_9BURK
MWKLGKIVAMFRKELLLAWAMLRDPRAPMAAKVTAVLALVYVISPIDLVSDFIPILGWLDDGLIAYLLLQAAFKFLPADLHTALRSKIKAKAA